jgi:uncharacterized protein (DUF885 family)
VRRARHRFHAHSLLWLIAASACAAPAGTPPEAAPAAGTPAARITALADAIWTTTLQYAPIYGTFLGLPDARHDLLGDNSLAASERQDSLGDVWLARLRAIPAESLAGRPEGVTYGHVRELLEAGHESRICHRELMRVSQLSGWQILFAYLAQIQPVGTPQARIAALARWRAIPGYLDTEVAKLREGVRRGYTVPKGNVRVVLEQLDALLAAPAAASPLAAIAQRDSTPEFRAQVLRIMEQEINPAIRRYRDFLATDYLSAARESTALASLPDGEACYRALVRTYTTLDLEPRAVHELGLAQMQRIEDEMRVIARRSFHTDDVHGLLQRLRTDSQYTFHSREEMVDVATPAIARAKAAAPRWFGRLPKAEMIVDPCQPFEEKSGCPGSYVPPAADGSHPGRYRINLSDPTHQPRAVAEATAFHEGLPGHHFQISLAQERPEAHPLTRFITLSGFAEGWGLYAEQLAEEMGLYTSDLDRMGRLSNDALRAARLVVDPGLHVLGWSRERAIEYMTAHTAESRQMIESEVDRYIIEPGQATAYMVGRLEIERLRREAQQRMGSKFDIRAFHDRVLENGAVPLPLLRENIERWIAAGGGGPTGVAR